MLWVREGPWGGADDTPPSPSAPPLLHSFCEEHCAESSEKQQALYNARQALTTMLTADIWSFSFCEATPTSHNHSPQAPPGVRSPHTPPAPSTSTTLGPKDPSIPPHTGTLPTHTLTPHILHTHPPPHINTIHTHPHTHLHINTTHTHPHTPSTHTHPHINTLHPHTAAGFNEGETVGLAATSSPTSQIPVNSGAAASGLLSMSQGLHTHIHSHSPCLHLCRSVTTQAAVYMCLGLGTSFPGQAGTGPLGATWVRPFPHGPPHGPHTEALLQPSGCSVQKGQQQLEVQLCYVTSGGLCGHSLNFVSQSQGQPGPEASVLGIGPTPTHSTQVSEGDALKAQKVKKKECLEHRQPDHPTPRHLLDESPPLLL